jgi:hypothetical protein
MTDWQNLSYRLLFVYPFFLIVIAYGVNQLRTKWQWGFLAVIVVVNSVGIYNYFTDQEAVKLNLIIPWREIFENIQTNAAMDASVVCSARDTAC